MALVVADGRRWQGHQPLSIVPLNALNQSRLQFFPKPVISYFGRRQECLRFNKRGVNIITGRLQRNSFLSIRFELKSGRSVTSEVTRSFSELRLTDNVRDGRQQTEEDHRPPFDLDSAVLLAGFAFESYNTPATSVGVSESDGNECETTYLSREFLESIYDGQLLVNLKKGIHFPGLDLWGTSDPYVVLRVGDCSARSRTIWINKDPAWDEKLTLSIKTSPGHKLEVTAWDANMVTAQRSMGDTSVSLDSLCDGKPHSLELDLEGVFGGGRLFLEIQFRSFAQIEAEENPFSLAGENSISVGEFMGDLTSVLDGDIESSKLENSTTSAKEESQLSQTRKSGVSDPELSRKAVVMQQGLSGKPNHVKETGNAVKDGDGEIWRNVAGSCSQTSKPFGIDISEVLNDKETWEVDESIKNFGLECQKKAELLYAESGLTIVEGQTAEGNQTSSATETNGGVSGGDSNPFSAGTGKLEGLIKQTDGIVEAWAISNKSQLGENQGGGEEATATESKTAVTTTTTSTEDGKADWRKQEDVDIQMDEIKTTMFSTAESAIEAWALLATTLGGTSSVKSEFEKICFVDNNKTDTQVALWRDSRRQRLVVAFRGTEQTKWKDVLTDLSVGAVCLKPYNVKDGSRKDESLVHCGFLQAYNSVETRILSLVRAAIDSSNIKPSDDDDSHWHIYVTGHSLGGALATLLALELSSTKLSKNQNLSVTMYNYGSPRVGNRVFAEKYNKIVKDSWRVVNHRDIVPTVPRIMGYCHVAQPIYLTAKKCPLSDLLNHSDFLDDGYDGDVIGESTSALIIDKFMRGEQTMIQKLLETEISILRAMRDGSAIMQHMEEFYYITLLQRVESRIL